MHIQSLLFLRYFRLNQTHEFFIIIELQEVNILQNLDIRRHPDSNWGIKALQASALPLGHAAIHNQNREISGRRDSDPRHSAWKADALPTELLPRLNEVYRFKYILQ